MSTPETLNIVARVKSKIVKMRKEQILNCMFSKWYEDFRSVTIKSHVIDLPDEVVKYLLSDGLVLPHGETKGFCSDLYSDNEDDVDWDSEAKTVEEPNFDNLNAKIRDCILDLGGSVIPKLNWSAPRDATWISFDKTMRCTCPADIFLLLKSSDFVTHDLTDPLTCCDTPDDATVHVTYQLILREWLTIAPQDEFRCFVVNNSLVGISQRYHSVFYPSLKSDKKDIANDIVIFFHNKIRERFHDSDFVFDVYRKSTGEVVLLDFNPFGVVTDSLLFEWSELFLLKEAAANSKELLFRFVERESGIKPHPYHCYAIPQDFVHLSSGLDPAKFMDLLNLGIQKNNETSSDEEGD